MRWPNRTSLRSVGARLQPSGSDPDRILAESAAEFRCLTRIRWRAMDDESLNHTWVYRYFYWDAEGRQEKTSHIYATLEAIRLGLGRHVPDSGIRVSNEDVA